MPLCQLCQSIDFSKFTVGTRLLDSAPVSEFGCPGEGFPAGLDLFYYLHDGSKRSHEAREACIPHHEDVEGLKNSSAICEICGLIQYCVNETFRQFLIAEHQGFHYPTSDYKFFLCPRFEADGFQVLGMRPEDAGATGDFHYDVMGGIGFCVDDGEMCQHLVKWLYFFSLLTGAKFRKSPRKFCPRSYSPSLAEVPIGS